MIQMLHLYRMLLRCYPADFRAAYGPGMVEMFALRTADIRRRKGTIPLCLFVLRELSGLIASALRERLGRSYKRVRSSRQTHGRRRRQREVLRATLRDFRQAFRRLASSPGFSLATIMTLALGIGANTAIFSMVYGVVLRPLPYPDSHRLVELTHSALGIDVPEMGQAFGTYFLYGGSSDALDGIAVFRNLPLNLTGDGDPERVTGAQVSYTLFEVLGIAPVHGRALSEDDDRPGAARVVVLSHNLWVRRYGRDPAIIGRSIHVGGIAHQVVGIMPTTFAFPNAVTEAWVPLRPDSARGFGGFFLEGIGRLNDGATPAQVQAELQSLIPRLAENYPQQITPALLEQAKITPMVEPLKEAMVGSVTQTLWIVLGTVSLVLLIACANVANLFLVRAEARHREVAVRTALGAGRGQIIRFFLAESVTLAGLGGAAGVLLAAGGVSAVVRWGPANIPRLHEVGIDVVVLAATALVALIVGLVFGAVPVFRYATGNVVTSLREGGRGATTGRARYRTRNLLVVSQVALSLILLVGSGLMLRTFWQLRRVDPGFNAEGLLTLDLALPGTSYPNRKVAAQFQQRLIEQIQSLAGVSAAGAVGCLPLRDECSSAQNPLSREGERLKEGQLPPIVHMTAASPGYFRAMQIPLRSGRTFEPRDNEMPTGAVLVSASLAERFWPGEDPVGRRVYPDVQEGTAWYTVVGVVGDVRLERLTDEPVEVLYLPMVPIDEQGWWGAHTMTVVVRTTDSPLALVDAVRDAVWSLDANLPIANLQTMVRVVSTSTVQTTFTMVLLGIAAVVALFLGAVGIYGVVSYTVSQRINEIGVRIALGAHASDVSRMILKQGGIVAGIGLLLGVGGALALTTTMEALLFGVSATDPPTYIAVSLLLLAVALAATYLPARRAAAVDPIDALRVE